MQVTPAIRAILGSHESDNPGSKANLARIPMQGSLGGAGRLASLPVDQGFEQGPACSFARWRRCWPGSAPSTGSRPE